MNSKLHSEFADRSVLITGCSSGIGYCVALGLHQRGYRVFATARDTNDVNHLASLGLESFQLDLNDSKSIHSAVDEILDRTGQKLYALFNNGAYGQPGAVEDLTRDTLRAQFETNVFGTIEITNRIIPVMRRQGVGRIIHNSSILGLICLPFRGAYNASKFALEAFGDTLRMELRGSGIEVVLIEPGPILSQFRKNAVLQLESRVDCEHSVHREEYTKQKRRLRKEGAAVRFTLPPEAVLKKLIHALEARRPKPRYYVTFPTYLFGFLRHVLPTRWLDRLFGAV